MDSSTFYIITIYASVALALLWALMNTLSITSIKIGSSSEESSLINNEKLITVQTIGERISKGANAFLYEEYMIMSIFIVVFAVIVLVVVDVLGHASASFRAYAAIAFVTGAITSMLCGYIGMKIAVAANYRTTYKAMSSLSEAFTTAFRAGCVMGFSSVGVGLGVLLSIMLVYTHVFEPITEVDQERSYSVLMELIAGYGLGGSSMALFGRVGGGIYTKAADVGADLVGKVEHELDEDSPRNPATIADNVGDNVGDIAGMGSDLFGSFAESTCAALVVIANTADLIKNPDSLYFPLLISACGIFACFITSIIGIYVYKVDTFDRIAKALNLQLFISTVITLGFLIFAVYSLPATWTYGKDKIEVGRWSAYVCATMGLVSGFIIGMSTDYYTSHAYSPVRDMAKACTSGTAINIIYGLALGYLSTIIPVIFIALTVLVSINLLDMLGVALAAIGMLSTLSVGLAIDAYGPISDNAGGIAEMSELGEGVRKITDALDAAGNTTAAVGKGFAIGSAALVALALYGAFITRARNENNTNPIRNIEVTNPWIFCSLLLGSMLPYAFSAMTMKSVGKAAQEMVEEVRVQFRDPRIRSGEIEPDYQKCITVSTKASIKEMIAPGLLVMLTPLVFGIFFHPVLVAGLLPGALLSGVQLAISMANTGGAWDNTKKFIESGVYVNANGEPKGKNSDEHKAAVIGDTVGDPLKDTSGPSLNILIKLMAIISLVFAGGFDKTALLAKFFNIQQK